MKNKDLNFNSLLKKTLTKFFMNLVKVPEVGVPKIGVTKVGLVAKTSAPDPVSLEITPAN